MFGDLRVALRGLLAARGLTLAAVATLALGVGASTLVWSFVDGLVFRPLPFGERTERLVTLHSTHPTQQLDWDDAGLSYADLVDLRAGARTLEAAEGVMHRNFSLAADGVSERVLGASVTPGLFALLGVAPELGRGFRAEEGAQPGHETAVILGHALWTRRYDGDPAILGRPVLLNGREVTVVGVMPEGFRFPEVHDLWLPYAATAETPRDSRGLFAVGLLRSDTTVAAAREELGVAAERLAGRYPQTNRGWGVHVLPLHDYYVGDHARRILTTMLAAVLLVLLVACANVSGLLLARGIGRQQELTVRAALGAARWRLVRLLLAESLLLAATGAGLGVLAARAALRALVAVNPDPPPYWVELVVDGRSLLFVVAIAVASTVACGLAPALRVSRVDLRRGLGGGRTMVGGEARRLQGSLVVGQVAAGLSLLIVATLLSGSARQLSTADTGFDRSPLLSLRVYLPGDAYDEPVARAQALQRVAARLEQLPGVRTAAVTGAIPGDDGGDGIRIVPDRGDSVPGEELGVQMVPVAGDLWATLGLALTAGRDFTAAESLDAGGDVALVNAGLAAALWPGQSAVGRRVGIVDGGGTSWVRVVGIAPDLLYEEAGEETPQSQRIVYLPAAVAGWRTMALLVRAAGDPAGVAGDVARALREIDPALAPYDVLTMTRRQEVSHWSETFLGRLFAGFAAAGLLLACIGSYGLTAYAAERRRREMGLRLAIGATAADLQKLLLHRGARLAIAGVLLGLAPALAAARVLEGLLYGVSAWNPAVWLTLPAAIVGVVLVACWLPARRASRVDPATALRQE
jgi:putative ABC transport system permease protein